MRSPRCHVLPLCELQGRLRNAVIAGDATGVETLLIGGADPKKRLAIHRRHYESSLVTALLTKFPATTWLIGNRFMEQAAREFVRDDPPSAPCIAEYGYGFPEFLSARAAAKTMFYLQPFAELDWHLGQVAISVELPAISLDRLSDVAADALMDAKLRLQPGLRYLHASWPVDELIQLYLGGTEPEHFPLTSAAIWLELCGARGQFEMVRLDSAEFIFREAIWRGRSIGEAAERAVAGNSAFDAGRALVSLITSGRIAEFVGIGGEA